MVGMHLYLMVALGVTLSIYALVWRRGEPTGWWIGLGHAVLALLAISAWSVAGDTGFAVAMALVAIYGGAMATAEVVHRLRGSDIPASGA